jgi:hypothetical protein
MVGAGGGEALTCTSCGGGGDTLRRSLFNLAEARRL